MQHAVPRPKRKSTAAVPAKPAAATPFQVERKYVITDVKGMRVNGRTHVNEYKAQWVAVDGSGIAHKLITWEQLSSFTDRRTKRVCRPMAKFLEAMETTNTKTKASAKASKA